LQQQKSLVTFKVLLYKCYARGRPIGAESKEQEYHAPWHFLAPSGQSGDPWYL